MLRRRFHTVCSVCCERGDIRRNNQDAVFARQGRLMDHQIGMFMVADGCGGMEYGETISRLLRDSFERIWDEALPPLFSVEKGLEGRLHSAVCGWIQQINETACGFGRRVKGQVGSTLTVLLTLDGRYYIWNVGDSRVYLRRGKRLCRLTEDQSLLADMLRNGEIAQEEAAGFRRKHVLTMCVGYFEELKIFQTKGKLRRGDLFLLCSDGFYHGVGEARLAELLPEHVVSESAERCRNGIPFGRAADNVSVILVEIIP